MGVVPAYGLSVHETDHSDGSRTKHVVGLRVVLVRFRTRLFLVRPAVNPQEINIGQSQMPALTELPESA
jgi:hypothetical protein